MVANRLHTELITWMNKEVNKILKPEPVFAKREQIGAGGESEGGSGPTTSYIADVIHSPSKSNAGNTAGGSLLCFPGTPYSVRSLIREHLKPTISPALLSVVADEMETQNAGSTLY